MFGLSSVYSNMLNFKAEDGHEIRKRVYYIDFCLGIVASKGNNVDILEVFKFLFDIKKKGYPIKKITTDSQQGFLARQIITSNGIQSEYLSLDRTKEPYLNLKNTINERLLIGYKNPPLIKDLKNLREYSNKIAKPNGKGHSDDMSNALGGALYTCMLDKNGFKSTSETINSFLVANNNNNGSVFSPMSYYSEGIINVPQNENKGRLGIGY